MTLLTGKILKTILDAASSRKEQMDEETKAVLESLYQFCGPEEEKLITFDNLVEYKGSILWKGADDVRYLTENEIFEEEFEALAPDEKEKLIEKTSDRVCWDDVESAGIEAGNRIIETAFYEVLRERNQA